MKKKFKILIMAISVIAMLFSFAIASSAETYITEGPDIGSLTYNDKFTEPVLFTSGNVVKAFFNGGNESFESYISYGDSDKTLDIYVIEGSWGSYACIIDMADFRDFCSLYNISDASSCREFLINNYLRDELGNLLPSDSTTDFIDFHFNNLGTGFDDPVIEKIFNYMNYDEITQEDLQDKYDEGKVEGVEEFKSSEEYTNVLNNRYSTGYAEGIEAFKVSKAYTDALEVQYSTGKTDGVTEFKKSVAFANSLKAEYDEGYNAGVTDTEGQVVKNEFTKVISVFIGVMAFGIILMSVLGVTSKLKKKKHR